MTYILIIFFASLIVSSLVLLNKHKEDVRGKGFFQIGSEETDMKLINGYQRFLDAIHHLTVSVSKQHAQRLALKLENSFIKLFHYLTKRFYSISNIITGHNIPKNKGSASFFLKNIEEHKKIVSGR